MLSRVEMRRVGERMAKVMRVESPHVCVLVDGLTSQELRAVLLRSRSTKLTAAQVWSPPTFLVVGTEEVLTEADARRACSGPVTYSSLYAPDGHPTGLVCLAVGLCLEQITLDYLRPSPSFPWFEAEESERQREALRHFDQILNRSQKLKHLYHGRLADFSLAEALRCARLLSSEDLSGYPQIHREPQICMLRTGDGRETLFHHYIAQGCAVLEGIEPRDVHAALLNGRVRRIRPEDVTVFTEFIVVGDPRQNRRRVGMIQATLSRAMEFLVLGMQMRWLQSEMALLIRLLESPQSWSRLRALNRSETLAADVRKVVERHRQEIIAWKNPPAISAR